MDIIIILCILWFYQDANQCHEVGSPGLECRPEFSLNTRDIMRIIKSIKEMKEWRNSLCKSLAFVPTMGALHEGHCSLIDIARESSVHVCASIYVNPTQFSITEDLSTYPQSIESDLKMLSDSKVDAVFLPRSIDMYPRGSEKSTFVDVKDLSQKLEGSVRPHFFIGVATVLTKLLNIIRPNVAVFGQKDIQQCALVKALVKDLMIDTDIIVGKTARELDGLAMSSRNVYLNEKDRKTAPILYKALKNGEQAFLEGNFDRSTIIKSVRDILSKEAENIEEIQYVSLSSPETLEEIDRIGDEAYLSAAIKLKSARILDNIILQNK